MRKVVHATSPFWATWLRQLRESPQMLVLKFVTSVLELEKVTENLLLKWLLLDQVNSVHLS